MALIEGEHCSLVEQKCLEHNIDAEGNPQEPICMRFEKPSTCTSTGKWNLRFCMDQYEYPNQEGEMPRVLVSYKEAEKLCADAGKRLCKPAEFNFACEGEEMNPYATGYERDRKACNIDKEWHQTKVKLQSYDKCMKSPKCTAEFQRLDQRHAIGSVKTCKSVFGVYDLNGNVNEWVSLPWGKPPFQGAIKGGWWGPVRNRCRPIVTSHDELYTGYEVGFRCCKDAGQ